MSHVRHVLLWLGVLACGSVWAGDVAPTAGPQVRFMGKEEAAALWSGDQDPPYLGLLSPREVIAKTGAALPKNTDAVAARRLCRERYAAAMQDFTESDKALLEAGVADAHAALLGAFPKMAELPWVFATGTNAVEGGLPHTRGPAIFLSRAVLEGLAAAKKSQGENGRWGMLMLLVHEQTHVFQRANPLFFRDLYESVWGYRLLPNSPQTAWTTKHQVVNPDAPDWRWAFQVGSGADATWYVPFLALDEKKAAPRMGQDFEMHALPVREGQDGQWQVTAPPDIAARIPSDLMAPYVDRFPPNSGVYHPEEVTADLVSQLTLFEFTGMRILKIEQTRQAFERWFAKPHQWLKDHLGATSASSEAPHSERFDVDAPVVIGFFPWFDLEGPDTTEGQTEGLGHVEAALMAARDCLGDSPVRLVSVLADQIDLTCDGTTRSVRAIDGEAFAGAILAQPGKEPRVVRSDSPSMLVTVLPDAVGEYFEIPACLQPTAQGGESAL